MRGKKSYWLVLGVTSGIALMATIVLSTARAIANMVQGLSVVTYDYATPVPPTDITPPGFLTNWWVIGGIISAITAITVVIWLVIIRQRL